jgi:hypothetical protein
MFESEVEDITGVFCESLLQLVSRKINSMVRAMIYGYVNPSCYKSGQSSFTVDDNVFLFVSILLHSKFTIFHLLFRRLLQRHSSQLLHVRTWLEVYRSILQTSLHELQGKFKKQPCYLAKDVNK